MENNDKQSKGNLGLTIFIILLSVLLLFFSVRQQILNKDNQKELTETISNNVSEQVKNDVIQAIDDKNLAQNYPDYVAIQKLHSLDLAVNFETWTPEGKKAKDKVLNTLIVEKGKIVKGYLYIKASLNEQALTKWESVFVMMNYEGGHLFRPQTLPIPPSGKTELLYALNDVPFLKGLPYSERRLSEKADWYKFFGDNKQIRIEAFISSLKPSKIEKMVLYYDCTDSSDCKIDFAK